MARRAVAQPWHRRGIRPPRRAALLVGVVLASGLSITAAVPVRATPSTVHAPPARFTLPAPTGQDRIGTVALHLVDRSRPDPWVPAQRVRHLMIQLWYPADTVRGYPRTPWMTPVTARAYEQKNRLPALGWPRTHGHLGAPARERKGGWPVLLYSPGLGGLRTETTALVEDLASHGYVVVTIDHVHDADAVELPGGHLETTALPELTDENELQVTTKAVEARVADTRFVLDQVAAIGRGDNPDVEHQPLPHGLRGAFDLRHVGMFGHSDGGTTTAAALHADRRIRAGINLDGTLWTPDAVGGSGRPLLLFGKEDLDPFQAATWAAFWPRQRGPKLQLNVAGSTHATFQDIAVLLPQAAPILGTTPEQVAAAVGTINGERAVTVLRTYVNAYFDHYLRHQRGHLLDGPSPRYPEIHFAPDGPEVPSSR